MEVAGELSNSGALPLKPRHFSLWANGMIEKGPSAQARDFRTAGRCETEQ
jgi:hypothetical protein